jgi:hypothetical protein
VLRFSSRWLAWPLLAVRRKLRLSVAAAVAALVAVTRAMAVVAVAAVAAAVVTRATVAAAARRLAVAVVAIIAVAAARRAAAVVTATAAAVVTATAAAVVTAMAAVVMPPRLLRSKSLQPMALLRPTALPRLLPTRFSPSDPQALCAGGRLPCCCLPASDERTIERLGLTAGSSLSSFLGCLSDLPVTAVMLVFPILLSLPATL